MSESTERQLIQSIRDWTQRPPQLSSPSARVRVLAQIESRQGSRRRLLLPLAAAAAVALLTIGIWVLPEQPEGPPPPGLVEAGAPAPSTPVLAYEMDSGTLLFVTLPRRRESGPFPMGL